MRGLLPYRDARGRRREEAVGAALDALPELVVLHGCRLTSTRGRPTRDVIDHLVVAPAGVWVIDAKTHYGPVEVRRSGGILTPAAARLFVNNRDRADLIKEQRRRVETVRRVLADADQNVPVRGALCFVGATLPWVSEAIADIALVDGPGLVALVAEPGKVEDSALAAAADVLSERFR